MERFVYVIRFADGREWGRLLYPQMAYDVAARSPGLTVTEERDTTPAGVADPMGILVTPEEQ